jgi:hypothetical protein
MVGLLLTALSFLNLKGDFFMKNSPKFTDFADERAALSSRLSAHVHAIGNKVVWASYDTTSRDIVQQLRKGQTDRFRVFPCTSHEEAVNLAKVLA